MEPLQKIEFALSFGATWSPWWLLLAVPVVAALAGIFYVRQSRAIARGHAWGLTILRVVIMLAVLVLAFRPSLIRRTISTYPARLLLVVDDSGSMGIPDPALPDRDAARVARKAMNQPAGRETPLDALREDVLTVERWLVRFEQFGRGADRNQDAFWREADRVQVQVNEKLDRIAEKASALAGGGSGTNRIEETVVRCRELKASLAPLFTGHEAPSAEFAAKMRAALADIAGLLAEAQGDEDTKALAAADAALKDAVAGARKTPRLTLVHEWLRRQGAAILENTRGLGVWMLPLSAAEPVALERIGSTPPEVSSRETDLTGVLLKCLTEENAFPLAGVVVFSDGRNLGDTSLEDVTRAAALRSVPVYSAGVGGMEEPPDIAVRDVYYAPFGVVGKPMGVLTSIKTALPAPENVDLELIGNGKTVLTNETLEIKDAQEIQRRPVFTPNAEGLHRYTMRAGSSKSEVVPQQNNRRDLLVRVRQEPVRVLFLDWKPRWESRFFLNILRRLDYLDVNAIIGLAQPKTQIKRGVGLGMWPENLEALKLYDLVILGDLPPAPAALTDVEWKQLADYVKDGGSLVVLGTGRQDPTPSAVAKALLPTQPRTAVTPPPSDTTPLQLTRAGRYHPVTRALQGFIPVSETVAVDRRRDDTVALLQTADGRILVSTRFVGKGKTLFVDTDRFWRRFNATSLDAHTAIVMSMTDWAVEARQPEGGKPQADLNRYSSRDAVQVWIVSDGTTNQVVEARDGDRVVTAHAVPTHPKSTLASAVFESLPPGDWIVSHGKESAPEPVRVLDQSRELNDLSRDDGWLRALAESTGGVYADFTEAGRMINNVQPRNRVEHRERVWPLWYSPSVLAALIVLLTGEWIWRKLAGLV